MKNLKVLPILKGIAKINKSPLQLIFYITNKCNLRCDHCFFWKQINKKIEELSLDEIRKIARSIQYLPILSLTGGEPFLRQDISDITKIFNDNTKLNTVVIPTNGFLTEQITNATKRMLEENKNINIKIDLSIDDIGKKHDENRGVKGTFERLLKTNNALRGLKKTYKNLSIGCVLTLTRKNQDHILGIYNYIRNRIKPDTVFINYIRGKPRQPQMADINLKQYARLIEQIKKDYGKNKNNSFYSNLVKCNNLEIYSLVKKTVKEHNYTTRCYAGIIDAVLYANGDVFPCEMLPYKIGNIRDFNYDFRKVWSSKKAKEIREKIKTKKCFCTHECFITTANLFNLKRLVPLLTRTSFYYLKGKQ